MQRLVSSCSAPAPRSLASSSAMGDDRAERRVGFHVFIERPEGGSFRVYARYTAESQNPHVFFAIRVIVFCRLRMARPPPSRPCSFRNCCMSPHSLPARPVSDARTLPMVAASSGGWPGGRATMQSGALPKIGEHRAKRFELSACGRQIRGVRQTFMIVDERTVFPVRIAVKRAASAVRIAGSKPNAPSSTQRSTLVRAKLDSIIASRSTTHAVSPSPDLRVSPGVFGVTRRGLSRGAPHARVTRAVRKESASTQRGRLPRHPDPNGRERRLRRNASKLTHPPNKPPHTLHRLARRGWLQFG